MENIGALAILLAFCLAVYAVIGSVVGKLRKKPFLVVERASAPSIPSGFCSPSRRGILVYSLLTGDFRLGYVAGA